MYRNARLLWILITVVIFIAIDFVSKWYFSGVFQASVFHNAPDATARYFPLIGEYFGIQLFHNQGVAFSLPLHGLPLQILTVLLIAGIIWYYSKYEYHKKSMLVDTAFVCIIAGALSHAYERITQGYVIDFLALKYFAIFNFADILITVGAILLFLYTFFYERK